jgi:hypothetical protein
MTRTRTCQSDAERQRVVDEFQHEGYAVVSDLPDTTVLRKRDHGSLLAHVVLFLVIGWATLGLLNLGYALYRRAVSKTVVEVTVADD